MNLLTEASLLALAKSILCWLFLYVFFHGMQRNLGWPRSSSFQIPSFPGLRVFLPIFRASSSRKLGREQKKEWRGRWRGKKETLLPSPSPFHLFFCSLSNFRAITRLEAQATPEAEAWRPEGTTGTDHKKSHGWRREKPKTKIRARENVSKKIYAKWNPKKKNFIHDKVLSLCVPRLKNGAKGARLIITWDEAQFQQFSYIFFYVVSFVSHWNVI